MNNATTSKDIVEALWHKLYTTGYTFEYYMLQDYCRENGFVYHPEEAMTDNHTEEEQRQLFNWLEDHLSSKGDEYTINFFRDYMNADV